MNGIFLYEDNTDPEDNWPLTQRNGAILTENETNVDEEQIFWLQFLLTGLFHH